MIDVMCNSATCEIRKLCARCLLNEDILDGVAGVWRNTFNFSEMSYRLERRCFIEQPAQCTKENEYAKYIPVQNMNKIKSKEEEVYYDMCWEIL